MGYAGGREAERYDARSKRAIGSFSELKTGRANVKPAKVELVKLPGT